MLLDDLQLEETDTIDEVESSDDSEFEVVEAPVNDEEPEQPEESPSVMELLLDVDEDSTENDAGAVSAKICSHGHVRVKAPTRTC